MSRRSLASATTYVPNVSRVKLMTMANDIYRYKHDITEVLKRRGVNARDKKTPSEILQVLKQAKVFIDL